MTCNLLQSLKKLYRRLHMGMGTSVYVCVLEGTYMCMGAGISVWGHANLRLVAPGQQGRCQNDDPRHGPSIPCMNRLTQEQHRKAKHMGSVAETQMDNIGSGGVGQSRALDRGLCGGGAWGTKMNGLQHVVRGQSARVHGDGSVCAFLRLFGGRPSGA